MRRPVLTRLLAATVLVTTFLGAGAVRVDGVEVRKDRPRIWLTPERIERMKVKAKANDPAWQGVVRFAAENPLCQALVYLVTGDEAQGRKAVNFMTNWKLAEVQLTPASTASDPYRWSGHLPIIVYDWCHPLLTAEEKDAFMRKFNRYVEVMNQKSWGGVRMPFNNYFGGHMRNSGLWGIASFHENDRAKEFLDHARFDRWEKSALVYFKGEGRGGVFGEGPGYSVANAQYYIQYADAVETASGEDLLKTTDFFKEFVYYCIYATTPAPSVPTPPSGEAKPYYQPFPYGDLENRPGGCPAWSHYASDIFLKIAQNSAGTTLGEQAQYWLNTVKPDAGGEGAIFRFIFEDPGRRERDFSDLPLAYYVPGVMQFYTRSDWTKDATAVSIQSNPSLSHGHVDAGTFQINRKGRWVTKEATGYSVGFKDCGCNDMAAHNGLLFGGKGPVQIIYAGYGPPRVVRLENRPEYAYLATDLSRFYNWRQKDEYTRHDKYAKPPYESGVQTVVREFVYLRPDTLVVFDRMKSRGNEMRKTFLLHCVEPPEIKEGEHLVVARSGDQRLFCRTVLPVKPGYSVVSLREGVQRISGDATYTWRTQISSEAGEEEYFLHVLSAADATGEAPAAKPLEENGKLGVEIAAKDGKYSVLFNKGLDALGGKLAIDKRGQPFSRVLHDGVQGLKVDDQGVHWEALKQ
jgi:hypothetical protein